ncbi:hypothetical protein [Devosia sp. DBB001]|nr:hypothetical protein [Devosia sp. DBB001]
MPDLRIPEGTIIRTARAINAIEDARDQANEDLKVTWADLREELKSLGLKGAEVSAEVGYLKAAIAETRKTEADHLKAEAKTEGMEGYLSILTSPRARARARDNQSQPETAEQSPGVTSTRSTSFAGTEGDEGQHPIRPETAVQDEPDGETDAAGDFEREMAQSDPAHLIDGNIVTDGLSRSTHSIPASPEPPSTLVGEGSGANPPAAPLNNLVPRSSSGLERMPGCKNLDACAGNRTKRCFTCERDWNAKAHEVDA